MRGVCKVRLARKNERDLKCNVCLKNPVVAVVEIGQVSRTESRLCERHLEDLSESARDIFYRAKGWQREE